MMASDVVVTLGKSEGVVIEADPLDQEGEILRGANSDGEELVIDAEVEEATQSDVTRGERRRTVANAMIGSGCDDDDAAVMNVVETTSNFSTEDELRTAEGGDGMVIRSRDTAECDSNYFSGEGFEDSSREENSLCCAKESCRDSEDDGDDKNSHTSLRLIEVNILGLDLLVKGFDSSYVKTDCHDGIRARLACLVEELRELCGQISDEDGKLLFTVETSQDEASCLLKNGNQPVEESKERSNVAAKLHLALGKLQKFPKQKLLPFVDIEEIDQARHKPKSSRDDADILQLEQQLQDLADENTRLGNRVEESSQIIENLLTKEAQVKAETAALVHELQRRKVEILQELGLVKERVEVLEEGKEESTSVIEDLKRELQRLQEENTGLKIVFNESSQVTQGIRADSSSVADECADERAWLKSQLDSVLEDKHIREEEVVEILQRPQEGVHAVEAEKKMLLLQLDKLTITLRRLEEEKNSLATRFDEHSQALQDTLGEKVCLADKVSRLEQDIQSSKSKFLSLSSELRATQDQLTASIKSEQLVVSELKQNKEEREEDNLKLTSNLQDLQVQLQALREENTHVVIKASKLDQLVEELKSDKLRLGSNLELLVRDGQRREQELRSDLGIWMEQVQGLEAEKLTSVTLVENLNTQVGRLVEDNERLMGVSSETSQSLQRLWEENRQFIEELNKLEQEKQAQEGEKMELVAGLQEIWEQLQAANNREADLVSEIKSLGERREFEEYTFIAKVKGLEQQLQDLEQQLQSLLDEKADITTRFVETTKVLEEFQQETSQKLSEMLEAKVLLDNEVAQLMKMKQESEEDNAREQTALCNRIQGLESEKAESLSTIEDLSGRVCASEDEINNHVEHIAKLKQFIQELRDENTRLGGEINKLEEVKERHEGERLELASELQAAWDQIQAVRESEANLATELSEVKELRAEETVRFDGLLQELQLQLKEVMEQKIQSGMKVEDLTKRLHELQKEQDLQDENGRLVSELSLLEQEKEKLALEGATLFRETQTLKDRVQTLEVEKNTLASEVEELNQWLQKPAAEKRQLASKLDEMTHSVQRLELEKTQLSTTMTQLQNETERKLDELERLNTLVMSLEEEKSELVAAHELTLRQLQSLEGTKLQIAMMHEHVEISNEKVHILEEESKSMASLLDNSRVQLQALEDEKTQLENLLEGRTALSNKVQMENSQLVSNAQKREQELEVWQADRQLLESHISNLEQEMVRLVEEDLMHKRELEELKEQFKCVIEVKDNHVEELKTNLEEYKQLLTQIEGKETHLLWEVHDCREELQKLDLDKTDSVPNLCQDLDSLLRNVGEEREKVAREHGLCLENRNLVSDLCGQLDGLLQRVREEKLKVAVDLSASEHHIRESRSFVEDEPTLELDKDQEHEIVLASENGDGETCISMETLKEMLQGCFEEKSKLEKDVTRLSLCLEESQSQLQVMTTRHSTKNPELRTKVQGWEDSQNFDQDDDGYDVVPPIHSIDDKYVTNYVREVEAKAYGKALGDPLDQGPDSPAWFKKEDCRTTTTDSYLQVHSMELLQQEKDAAVYAEQVACAKLDSLLLHLGKAEKGNNDMAIVVKELKDKCSVLNQENLILIDKLVKVSEGSSLATSQISTLTSELKEKILKNEEESDFRVQNARVERERDSSLVAPQECDFTHCDIAQKAQEEQGRLRSDLTKLLQEYETLTYQADYDSKQLKVLNVEKSDFLAQVCLLKEETCSDVDQNEIVSSLSADVSSDCEDLNLVTEAKLLEPGTPYQRHRNVVMEKNIEAVGDRLESSMSDVFCNTALGSTLTVSCSCGILDSLHRILLREISCTRRHLEQVQSELMEHKQHFAIFQKKLESSVLLLFPEALVTRSNGIGRLYELSDLLINVLLRECSKTSEKLRPQQLADVDILMEKVALVEDDTTDNVGSIGSEKVVQNCNMATLFSQSEDANLVVDLSNMNTYMLQSTIKEAMELKDLVPEEKKGELTALLCTVNRTIDEDKAPQLQSSGEVGEESESKLVLQRAMQTIKSLESELEFKKTVSSNLQEYLLERNSYIQLLEATFDKYNWPHDYPISAPLVDKIEWFGRVLACTAEKSKEQMEVPGVNAECHNSSKEVLVAKLAAFGKEVEEKPERDAALGEALQKIELLESELKFKKSVSANLQEYLLERNSYIQLLEATIGKYNWPHDYPVSAPLVDKIEWFGRVLACTAEESKEQMEVPGVNGKTDNSSKEVLVAKLATFGKEVEEKPERDAVLEEALQKIELLESELKFKRSVSANLQEYLLERNSYIQLLEATIGKYNWPHDYPVSAPLVDKIEWFGRVLACTEDAAEESKEQMEVPGVNGESHNSSKEELVAKLAAFGKEVEKEGPGRDMLLEEALQKLELLESELKFKKSVSVTLQEYLLERNSYIQLLEATIGKYNWPCDYPASAPLVDKIEYFGKVLACPEDAVENLKEQMEVPGVNGETDNSLKEVLVTKLATFGKEVEREGPGRDMLLEVALQKIELLESDLKFKKNVSATLQEYLLERNSYIQLLEATIGKYNWPGDYPASAPLVDKIEYFGKVLACPEDAVEKLKVQMEIPGFKCKSHNSSKEILVAKLATFGKEGEKEEPERDAMLGEALQKIKSLEGELEFKKSVSANLQENLLERNSYIQQLEAVVGKYNWPPDYPVSAPLVDKIEWFGKVLACPEDAFGNPKEKMQVSDKSSKEVLVAKLATFGNEVEIEEPAVLVPQESQEELQYPHSVSSAFDTETKSKKRSFLSVSEECMQEVEATFRKFSWPYGYPTNAPVCGKIEWLARFFVPSTSALARESLDCNLTLPDGMSETTTPVCKKLAVRYPTRVECSAEKIDSNGTLEQVQERLNTLQDQRTSFESEMDATTVCSCSRGSFLEERSFIQPVEVALEKCVRANDHTSPATLTDQVEWLAEAFSAMKPEVVRKSMGAETAEIFLTKLSYVTGLREALAGDRSFMASPTDSKYSQSGSALIGSPKHIFSTGDTTSVSKNDDNATEYKLTSLQQSLELVDYKDLLDSTFQKFSWPNDYPSNASLVKKIEWLGQTFGVREATSNDSQQSDSAEVETVGQLGSYIAAEDVVAVGYCKEAETILKSISVEVDCANGVHEKLVILEKRIRALEGELDFKRDVSSGLLQSLMERNSYIQAIEVAVGKFDWPEGYPSGGSLMDKIEWLGSTFTAVDGIGDIEEESFLTAGNSGDPESSTELFLALKETLVAKQAAFTRQASREKYEKDAALRQTRDTIADLESTISVLENDLEYNRGVSSGLQESLVESNGYIQMVEGVLGKFNWPGDYPLTESLSNRIQWLGETFGSVKQGVSDEANDKIEKCNGENDFYTPSKEVLAAKLVALTTQFSEQKSERDVALLEAHKRIVAMEKSIVSLESELEVKKGVSSALQQSLLEENRYIQMVEGTLDKCCWPDDYPSTAPLNDKIEWLVEHLAFANEELGTYKELSGEVNSRLSELAKKTVFLNTELSCVNREKEALAVKYAVLADQVIKEISGRDAALQEANERVGTMQCSISVLESKFEHERKSLCDLRQCFQEKSIQLDLVEDAVSKLVHLEEFPLSASVNDQIMWLANALLSTHEEVDRLRTSSDLMRTALKELHRKADTYCLENEVLDLKMRELLGNEQLVCILQKALSSRELELAELSRKVTEVSADLSAQETKNQSLLQEGRRTHAELEDAKRDKDALEMEVSQMNQKLSSAREKLGVAVSERNLIEKQWDFQKQALEEKIAELECSNVGHIQVLQVKDAELLDIKLKFEQSEEQRDLVVSALHEAVVENSLPADLNSLEPLAVIDWLVLEYVHGKETISLWMKRAEDSEKQVVVDRVKYESDLENTFKELRDIKLKLERSEGQYELFVSALQEALVESSSPTDMNSMEPIDIIGWLVQENVHGKEITSLWMKRADDSEKQVVADRVKYESDLQDTIKELWDIKLKLEQSEQQRELFVSTLHEALVESSLPGDLNSMEPVDSIDWLVRENVHGKETISLWMKRAEDSEKQVVSDRVKYESGVEDIIKELWDIKLKLEQSEQQCELFVSTLHEALVESLGPADLNSMEPLDIIDWLVRENVHGKETISLWMKRAEDSEKQVVADRVKYESDLQDTIKEALSHSANFSIRLEELEDIIQQKDNSLRNMELAHGQAVTKCSDLVEQLRESRLQCDVLAAEVDKLPETLRNKENDNIRLQDEAALMAGSSSGHVQSFREVSLDVGEESDDFFIDPRHGFNPLVNSRNIPNATRSVANQFDLLCFGAGRLFMRQPMARLALAAYWIFIHVWMAYFSLSATKYTKITHL